jgi:N-formylglutamate amidohydrolase
LAAGSGAAEKEFSPESLLTVQEGALPVILSAPHGGQAEVPGELPRQGVGLEKGARGFRIERDVNTEHLALEVAAALEKKLGKKPYYVVAKFQRKFADANRPASIAYEHPKAGRAYDAYHDALARFCKAVRQSFGCGLLVDIHGQSSARDTVFRGTQNGKTDRALVERFGAKAHAGPESFCGLLAAQGFTVVPTDTSRETGGFTGGYIVQTCGEREGIGAVQLEFGSNLRKDEILKDTAGKLADAIAAFAKRYLAGEPARKR